MEPTGKNSGAGEGIKGQNSHDQRLGQGAIPFDPNDLSADPRASFKPESMREALGPINLAQLAELSFREESRPDGHDAIVGPGKPARHGVDSSEPQTVNTSAETFAFVLGRVIGKGGMAEVREARQVSLGRMVAVKQPMVPPGASKEKMLVDSDLFAREAVITARLEHPNVVPVHELGIGPDGMPILAMKLVHGTRWPDLLRADRELGMGERLARNLPILTDVAQAVAFAHEHGIIHRDLKPGQVMVARHGEVYLMDWGLAVAYDRTDPGVESGSQVTALAAVQSVHASNPAGTPAYMAPEQTERTGVRLGPWTDVWLLGAILYDILTGTPPYPHDRSIEAFGAAARGEVEPPEERAAKNSKAPVEIPLELSQLCMECLKPGIGERIRSTSVFVQRVKAYQSGATRREESRAFTAEAIAVFKTSPTGRLGFDELEESDRKLSRALALDPENAEAVAAKQRVIEELACHALSGGDLKLARVEAVRLVSEAKRNELLKKIGSAEAQVARQRVQRIAAMALSGILVLVVAAVALFSRARIAEALKVAENSEHQVNTLKDKAVYDLYVSNVRLAQMEIRNNQFIRSEEALLSAPEQHRGWEWGYLMAISHLELMQYRGHSLNVTCTEFSPDGKKLASASEDKTVRIWEVFSGRQLRVLEGHKDAVNRVRWSADGALLATASADGTAALWNAETGQQTHLLGGHHGTVQDVHFTSDGLQVATLASDAHLRFFDAKSGTPGRDYDLHEDRAFVFDLSSNNHFAAIGVGLLGGVLLDLDSGTTVGKIGGEGELIALKFSPNGDRIASVTWGNLVRISTVPDCQTSDTLNPGAWINDLRWAENGNSLIGSQAANDNPAIVGWKIPPQGAPVKDPNGFILSPKTGSDFNSVAVSPDGRYIAAASARAVFLYPFNRQWLDYPKVLARDTDSTHHVVRWKPGTGEAITFGSSDSGPTRMTVVRDFPTTEVLEHESKGTIDWLSAAPDGKSVALAVRRFGFMVRSLATGREVFSIPRSEDSDDARAVTYSPDSSILVTVCSSFPQPHKARLETWSAVDGHPLGALLKGETVAPVSVAFSRDGEYLAVGMNNGHVKLLRFPSGEIVYDVPAVTGRTSAIEFSPNDQSIAAGGGVLATILVSRTGALQWNLSGHGSEVLDVSFSPDGKRLLTASLDETIGIWDVQTGRALNFLKGTGGRNWQAQWSPSGMEIATASTNLNCLRLWEAMPWRNEGATSGNSGATESSAAWSERLRKWETVRFEKYEVAQELEKLPNAYWRLDRLASLGAAVSDDESTSLSAQWLRELGDTVPERRRAPIIEAAKRFTSSAGHKKVESILPDWDSLRLDVEKVFLKGQTRAELEATWHSRFARRDEAGTSMSLASKH